MLMRLATATSAMILLGTLLLIAFRPQISLAPDFHVRADWGWSIRVADVCFFNDVIYGPYSGSILVLSSDDGTSPFDVKTGFDFANVIYYRYFLWDGNTLWTFRINLWCIAMPSAVLPGIWLSRRCWKYLKRADSAW